MPIEFIQEPQPTGSSSDTLFRLTMSYDGSGRRISKTRWVKNSNSQEWEKELVTHYTGIGTEVRENYAGPAKETKVVVKSLQGECRKNKLACSYDRAAAADAGGVNMPQGLGRYRIEDAERPDFDGMTGDGLIGYIPNAKFEWYLKNHLGSTMLVYGTQADANPAHSDIGTPLAAYDYRAFGEMIELTPPPTGKVTENFTGKERDDEIALDYFGARYLDPMLGMWISVDPARQFASPYLYVGNGMNSVNGVDPDGNIIMGYLLTVYNSAKENNYWGSKTMELHLNNMYNSKTVFWGEVNNSMSNFGYKTAKSDKEGVNREIFLRDDRPMKYQAATMVHEFLEGTTQMIDGKMVRYNAQDWHRPYGPMRNPNMDRILRYYKDVYGDDYFDVFLEDNYKGSFEVFDETLNKNFKYDQDPVYKTEYECLHGK